MESLSSFDARKFRYLILRQQYIELVCIKSEAGLVANVDAAVEEVVKVLGELENFSPSKEIYNQLCLLLTLPRLADHTDYRDWYCSRNFIQYQLAEYKILILTLLKESFEREGALLPRNLSVGWKVFTLRKIFESSERSYQWPIDSFAYQR